MGHSEDRYQRPKWYAKFRPRLAQNAVGDMQWIAAQRGPVVTTLL